MLVPRQPISVHANGVNPTTKPMRPLEDQSVFAYRRVLGETACLQWCWICKRAAKVAFDIGLGV
jgi:hypothetical protein